jgi:hypothetical protein
MKETPKKLMLNQETLANLTRNDPSFFGNTNHSCNSICGLPCTPKAGIN